MLIKKIELENITTHKKTIIEFQEGLNILLGQNGTGKSTIVKMIGYVLFDYLSGTQKSYVRTDIKTNPNHGMVKLWMVGLNDDLFIIEKTIGKSNNTIEVRDGRTGVIISNINDKPSLINWVKSQFALKGGYDLSTIFETSIGIPQGTFCEPFLRTPRLRMNFFNPILQVDVYRRAWEKMKDVVQHFSTDIEKIDIYIQNLSEYLLEKEKLKTEEEELNETLKEEIKELQGKEKELDKFNREFENINKVKEKRDIINSEAKQLLLMKENIQNQLEESKKALEEAKKAAEICEKAKKDHLIHLELLEKQVKGEKLNEELENLKERQQGFNELNTKYHAILEEKNKEKEKIESSQKNLTSFEITNKKAELIHSEIERIQRELAVIANAEERLETLKSKYGKTSKEFYQLNDELAQEERIKKNTEILDSLENKQEALKQEILVLETDLKNMESYKSATKEQNCPFLNQSCKNVSDDGLKKIFLEKIQEDNNQIEAINKELSIINKKVKELVHFREQLDALAVNKSNFQLIKSSREELIDEINGVKKIIEKSAPLVQELEQLKIQEKLMQEDVNEYQLLKKQIEEMLPSLLKEIQTIQQKINSISIQLAPIKNRIGEIQHVNAELKEIKNLLRKTRNNHDLYQKFENAALKEPQLEKATQELNTKLREKDSELHDKLKEKSEIESEFNENKFNSIQMERERVISKKSELETNIKNLQSQLEKNAKELKIINEREKDLKNFQDKKEWYDFLTTLTRDIRIWLDEAAPKITKALLSKINVLASQLYRDLMNEDSSRLAWEEDFNILIISPESERSFSQLSGGEQMAAALAVRLAILKILTNIDFAFFDEPTTNLDAEKRMNLAQCIQNVKGFKQLFVISHDDTFEEIADNVIKFTKDDKEITQVQFLKK